MDQRVSSQPVTRPPPATLTALICRGCCCGTARKHPEIDHEAQLAGLRAAVAAAGGRLRVTECLGPCERSNVVVLRARTGTGTTTIWAGGVLTPDQTMAFCARIAAFAGDATELTPIAGDLAFTPTEEAQACLAKAIAVPADV